MSCSRSVPLQIVTLAFCGLALMLPITAADPIAPAKPQALPSEGTTQQTSKTSAAEAASGEAPKINLAPLFAGEVPRSVEELRALEKAVTTVLPKLINSTIAVQVGASQGSGVIIDKEGHVLTAAHVIGDAGRDAIFIMPDGKRLKGKTLGANHDIDAGLMQITDKFDFPTVEWGDSSILKNGQWCLSLGHPGGFQRGRNPVIRLGKVFTSRKTLIATDCTIMPGDSGGPLFDLEGNVIGIHSRIGGPLTANIHVPIGAFREGWDRMVASETWGRDSEEAGPYLGVIGDLEVKDKAKLAQVNPNTPADRAGLRAGDIIQKFNDVEIKSFEHLAETVRKQKVGQSANLKVLRGDKPLDLRMRFGSPARVVKRRLKRERGCVSLILVPHAIALFRCSSFASFLPLGAR
jgi:serine protease Do